MSQSLREELIEIIEQSNLSNTTRAWKSFEERRVRANQLADAIIAKIQVSEETMKILEIMYAQYDEANSYSQTEALREVIALFKGAALKNTLGEKK